MSDTRKDKEGSDVDAMEEIRREDHDRFFRYAISTARELLLEQGDMDEEF